MCEEAEGPKDRAMGDTAGDGGAKDRALGDTTGDGGPRTGPWGTTQVTGGPRHSLLRATKLQASGQVHNHQHMFTNAVYTNVQVWPLAQLITSLMVVVFL